jgi:hypothetical protein
MHLVDEDNSIKPKMGRNLAYSFLNSITYAFAEKNSTVKDRSTCKDHDHEQLKPHMTSTWMPAAIGSMAGKSVVFAEAEVIFSFFCHSSFCSLNEFLIFRLFKSPFKYPVPASI